MVELILAVTTDHGECWMDGLAIYLISSLVDKYFIPSILFYPTIARKYFVKTRTYVALFSPQELSLFFSGDMYLEVSAL